MPRLFEIAHDQPRPLAVAERDGKPVLRLQRGQPVTDELVEELNQLVGDDYYDNPPQTREMDEWFATLVDSCLPAHTQLPTQQDGRAHAYARLALGEVAVTLHARA